MTPSAQLSFEPLRLANIVVEADGRVALEGDAQVLLPNTAVFIGDDRIANAFGMMLPSVLADLVDIAMATYLADRLVRRNVTGGAQYELQWRRRFFVTVPVRNLRLWRKSAIRDRLKTALELYTDDDWQFHFVRHPGGRRASEVGGHLFRAKLQRPVRCALFSGGLDSLAGLCAELSDFDGTHVIFAGSTNGRLLAIQRGIALRLRAELGRQLVPVLVPFGFRRRGASYHGDERTQRCRGFVFACLGAATAVMARTNELAIYENGVGAINLPYLANQVGAQATRAVNPIALAALSDLVTHVTERPFRIVTPFIFDTKAQLCRRIPPAQLHFVRDTVSCDGFPQRSKGQPQCGWCTSCLLRRQALFAADLKNADSTQYRHDLLGHRASVPEAKQLPINAMLAQVASLQRALQGDVPWRVLTRDYPVLVEVAAALAPLNPGRDIADSIVSLYGRYVEEWGCFRDYPWARPWLLQNAAGGGYEQ